jgi:hypothetical protein
MSLPKQGGGTGWQPLSFAANWGNLGGGAPACRVRKDANGRVWLAGVATKGVALALPDTIGTLPAGYRPLNVTQRLVAPSAAGYAEVRVDTAGNVILQAGGAAAWTSVRGDFDPGET